MPRDTQENPLDSTPGQTGAGTRIAAVPDIQAVAADVTLPSLMGVPRVPGDTATVPIVQASSNDALPVTVRIGRYELFDVLGSGGQGVVYKALQRGAVERTVALKTLRAEGLAAE